MDIFVKQEDINSITVYKKSINLHYKLLPKFIDKECKLVTCINTVYEEGFYLGGKYFDINHQNKKYSHFICSKDASSIPGSPFTIIENGVVYDQHRVYIEIKGRQIEYRLFQSFEAALKWAEINFKSFIHIKELVQR